MEPFSTSPYASGMAVNARALVPIAQLDSIAAALAVVHELRVIQSAHPALLQAVRSIKRAQCQRFRHSYADVLVHPDWGQAAQFFLNELYGDRDFSQRDDQFSRIAQPLQRLFPQSVVGVATTLAQLHALSEQLDHAMGCSLLLNGSIAVTESVALNGYVQAWRATGHRPARADQLTLVLHLGHELARLTRTQGLRMMLRLMRSPAHAAGLQHLQEFLELGFDTFAALQRSESGVAGFLTLVKERECEWMERLFSDVETNASSPLLWPELE
jgi:hypothetical protein